MTGRLAATFPLAALAALALSFPGDYPAGAQGWSIVALEAPGVTAVGAHAINNSGQVTGGALFNGAGAAFLWTPTSPNALTGTFKNLGTPKSFSSSGGRGLTILGDVAGGATGTGKFEHAVFWPRGGSAQVVGPSGNYVQTRANAVNSAGQVVGWYPGQGAFLSQVANGKRKLFVIGEGYALSINESGRILVFGARPDSPYFFQVTGANGTGVRTNLTGATQVSQMNEAGEVSGSVSSAVVAGDGNTYQIDHAGLYLPAATHGLPAGWTDLGMPPNPPPAGEWLVSQSLALADGGLVVGGAEAWDISGPGPYETPTAVTYWVWDPDNGMRDLNQLLAGSGWTVTEVGGVNSAGEIIGKGTYNGAAKAFLLSLQ